MRVVLTGAEGNLGRHIKKNATFDLVSIGRNDWEKLGEIEVGSIDVLIHAAYDLKNSLQNAPSKVLSSNLLSTALALEFAREQKVKAFYFVSSCAVYGKSSLTTEELECFPVSFNGYTKLINEKLVEEFCTKNKMKFHFLRVFNSYGGDDHFSVISHLNSSIRRNEPFSLFNHGISQRDFIHINDVAKILVTLVSKEITEKIINVGTGKTTQLKDLVELVQKKFGKISIVYKSNFEAEYSRANITTLLKYYDKEFVNVTDYVQSDLFWDMG